MIIQSSLFDQQHSAFINGIDNRATTETLTRNNSSAKEPPLPDNFNETLIHYQNFIEGDSTIDLISDLDEVFSSQKHGAKKQG